MIGRIGPASRGTAILIALLAVTSVAGAAPTGTESASGESVDLDVQSLKKELVDLNKELFKLEEELLYPASTQVAVFLSVDVGTFFALDSVTLKVDDKEVTNYLYTEREVQALHRGGVQRLYLGNLKAGEHELIALFTGKGPHDRDYRRGTTLRIDKGVGGSYIELKISDRVASLQPEFVVKVWE